MVELYPWIAIAATVAVFLTLQLRRPVPTDVLFLGALMGVTVLGVISPRDALAGFSSQAILTIAGLLVCAQGLQATGVLDWIGGAVLGSINEEQGALRRLAVTLIAASAFVLNTALVAMAMPVVIDWCRKRNISPSRLLIPVSYLAMLGGVCTLVGTSTTLIVNEMLNLEHAQYAAELSENDAAAATFAQQVEPMGLFELGYVGLPCAVVGGIALVLLAPRLLPDRLELGERFGDEPRDYLVEMRVQPDCPLIGKTVERAGLRSLPGLFLIEIARFTEEIITPVTPKDIIRSNDRLVFTGIVSTIVDLENIPGLTPAADSAYDRDPGARRLTSLVEVVVSPSCPLIGSTVRDGGFRQRYSAAIIAIHRNGKRLTGKIGDVVLEPGDTLLLQTRWDFVKLHRHNRAFYLVSDVREARIRRHDKAPIAVTLAMILIGWLSVASFVGTTGTFRGFSSHAIAAIAIAGLMVVTRCLTVAQARGGLNIPLLLSIAGALGLGRALDVSGADDMIASWLVSLVGNHPMLLLVIIYVLTMVFTEMITNNAVAATLLPLAIATAHEGGYNPRPFIMAITLAASLAFLTPIGYQTNLMVMGPGGYRPRDFLRLGLPLAILVATTALLLIPWIWRF